MGRLPALRDKTLVNIYANVNQTPVYAMVNTFTNGIKDVETLASQYILGAIHNEIIDKFVPALAASAGPGWPLAYTEHLVAVMHRLPITITTTGEGFIEVQWYMDSLGDYKDLEKGFHMGALIHGNETGSGHAERGNRKHHGLNPHPARISLPYRDQPLIVQQERRKDFWEQVIVGRDLNFPLKLKKGRDVWTYGELIDYLGYPPPPTFEEVALARTFVWKNKAPQWLILENGSGKGAGSPSVFPVNFSGSIETVGKCVATRIFYGVMVALIELSEQAGAKLGTTGLPYSTKSGQFVPYSKLLNVSIPDLTPCFRGLV